MAPAVLGKLHLPLQDLQSAMTLRKLLLSAVGLLVLHAVWKPLKILYNATIGPVSKIPGPFVNKLSSWPLSLQSMSGRRIMYIEELRHTYGDVCMIAPDKVAVNDLGAVKQIHKIGSPFLKTEWYANATGEYDSPGMFAMRDPKAHGQRRKLFAHQFAKRGVLDYEELIQNKFALAIEEMQKRAVDGKIDLMLWWAYLAIDLIGEMLFGESFHTLEMGKPSQYLDDLHTHSFVEGLRSEFPLLCNILLRFPIPSVIHSEGARVRQREHGRQAFTKWLAMRKAGKAPQTIFADIVDEMDVDLAAREAQNILIAGTDTTVVSLTYLIWVILKHPDINVKLQAELATLPEGWSIDNLTELPFLNKIVNEALRLWGAGPGSLPRQVPPGGAHLGGHYIPSGFEVSTQAWSLHHNGDIFPDPDKFLPERWDEPTREMKDAFMPFASGSRVCLGQHLARIEMLVAAAQFFRAFPEASIPPETTDDKLAPVNYFLISPQSRSCVVKVM